MRIERCQHRPGCERSLDSLRNQPITLKTRSMSEIAILRQQRGVTSSLRHLRARQSLKVEKDISKFDWVTERSSCSLPNVFKALRLQAVEDVKTRNALRPNNSPYKFSVAENDSDFTVLLEAKDVRKSVICYRPVIFSSFSGYRAPSTLIFEAALSMSRRSLAVSSTATAPMFSSRRFSFVVPGIGTIHGS